MSEGTAPEPLPAASDSVRLPPSKGKWIKQENEKFHKTFLTDIAGGLRGGPQGRLPSEAARVLHCAYHLAKHANTVMSLKLKCHMWMHMTVRTVGVATGGCGARVGSGMQSSSASACPDVGLHLAQIVGVALVVEATPLLGPIASVVDPVLMLTYYNE